MPIQFQTRGAQKRVVSLLADAQPTQGDLISGALLHRNRILERTAKGVDLSGRAFADYSDVGPIYIDLGVKIGPGRTAQQRISAAKRFSRKVGLPGKVFRGGGLIARGKGFRRPKSKSAKILGGSQKAAKLKEGPVFRLIRGVTPIGGITPGGFLKLASYRQFKLSVLGRSVVDLFGHRAPHMLQALIVRFGGGEVGRRGVVSSRAYPQAPTYVEMGLFGEEAGRGIGHNIGARSLPRRHWFGFAQEDIKVLREHILGRILTRTAHRRSA